MPYFGSNNAYYGGLNVKFGKQMKKVEVVPLNKLMNMI